MSTTITKRLSFSQAARPRAVAQGAAQPPGEISPVARACLGLLETPKVLPPWLFYDDRGSALFEQITRLPEYYPTRVERAIFEERADAIFEHAARAGEGERAGVAHSDAELSIVELGAGTATKTDLLLAAAVRRQGPVRFYPSDVSPLPLQEAAERLARTQPQVAVSPLVGTHEAAFRALHSVPGRRLVLFIGSSIGNFEHLEAMEFLSDLRSSLRAGDGLLLGTDLRKDPAILVPAYDDAAGVTAAFNLNLLTRLNREVGAHFDPAQFRHVALWNDAESRIEMHLESRLHQMVRIDALNATIRFAAGERIHTESSHKYDEATIDLVLGTAGFERVTTFTDVRGWFAVNLAVAV
ncbi:MAG TPA: L-histidine N(alpha)-methyltransferase [Burkholderiaceae bacterium]|nr:L-histidine N(alpha)-methyltransferase [Burkholderiaceae bacterium]